MILYIFWEYFGSLFLIKLQAQWLLLIGVKFTLKNACVNLDSRTTEAEGVWITVMGKIRNQKMCKKLEIYLWLTFLLTFFRPLDDIGTGNFPKINTVYHWTWFDFHLFYFRNIWNEILMTMTGYQAKMLKKNIWIKFWYIFNKLSSFFVMICLFINRGESRSGRNHIA